MPEVSPRVASQVSTPSARLHIQYGDGRQVEVPLNLPEMVIGRDVSCEIPLDDAITSRRHARIYRDNLGHFWIQDLRSKNGTIVNQKPVTTARLSDTDRIEIGGCRLALAMQIAQPVLEDTAPDSDQFGSTSVWNTRQRFELPQQRLEKLYELNTRLTGRFDRDDLLREVLNICLESFRFERAGVAIWRGEPHAPQWVIIRNSRNTASEEFRISGSLVDRALRKGERILHDSANSAVDPTASMISNNIRSAMCVPMEYHQAVHGVIYGDRVTSTGGYTREDIDFFAALGRLAAMGLANVQLVDEMKQRQQMELQFQWAREIQANLFPAEPYDSNGTQIDALNDPGQRVSGDYFDYFARDDGLITVVMADVCGKGAPAALLMANFQAAVHVTMSHESDLTRVAEILNRLISRNVRDTRFITAIFGLLDPVKRTFTYVNAGHMPPVLLEAGEAPRIIEVEPALPLGIEPEFVYKSGSIELPTKSSALFFYTDGVPDAEDPQGEQFMEKRLMEALGSGDDLPPGELISRVRRSVSQFTRNHPLTDDITMLAFRVN
jgi:sigma-B regulation protein RsbU (phosphoserine phosphatase)